jgi:hypothetical protein
MIQAKMPEGRVKRRWGGLSFPKKKVEKKGPESAPGGAISGPL